MQDVLILGVGNILQGDEGLGVHMIYELKRWQEQNRRLPPNVEVQEGGTSGFNLLPLLQNRRKIIIVDAVRLEGQPGEIFRFPLHVAPVAQAPLSLHGAGIVPVIEMLRMMGENPEIEVIGIIPETLKTAEMSVSESVRRSVPRALLNIIEAAVGPRGVVRCS